jgi:Protein of unknown function (DUF2815)
MSQSQQFHVSDTYLADPNGGMWIPQNDLTVDPQYGSVRIVTPIGRLAFLNISRPKQIKQQDGSMGNPIFSGTILLNPNACGDIYRAIAAVATHRFPPETKPDPQNPQVMRQYTAEELLFLDDKLGGLHYPLRAGSENYMRDPVRYEQWRELFFVNASMSATDTKGNPQRPIYLDASGQLCDPSIFYSGCYGSMQLTFYAYPKAGTQGRGSRGVGVGLNAVRFANQGAPMGTFDAAKSASEAFAKAGNFPRAAQPAGEVGYGPHTGSPGSVPPGVAMPGFAAPPPPQQAQQQAPAYQPQQQQAPVGYQPAPPQGLPPQPPQSGYMPAGARPPG